MASETFAGPVDFIVFTFEETADLGAGLSAVLERVQQGIVEILDLEIIGRDESGAPSRRGLADLPGITGIDLAVFDGISSGILDDDDLSAIASELPEGHIALAVVYEDRSLAEAAGIWSAAGGVELFAGGIAIDDLADAIEEGNQP